MPNTLNLFGQVVLFSCIPMILVLFAYLPARRAVFTATIVSWLFLPNAGIPLPGLPDYTKTSATTAGTLLGAILFDLATVIKFRPRWYDLPMFVWCGGNFLTSVSNDLGVYDGISAAVSSSIMWGLPYFLGRVYLRDLASFRDLAYGVVIGAAAYVPLCLWEIKMSPTVYEYVYGMNRYSEPTRFGFGYRPVVFMASGLEVGMWLGAGFVCSYVMWRSKTIREVRGFKFLWFVVAIGGTLFLAKSVGAILLAVVAVGLFEVIHWSKKSLLIWVVILTPPVYITVRTTGLWDGRSLVNITRALLTERSGSIETRIDNENLLVEKALQRPLLGWGGYSRNFVTDKNGRIVSITDGYWIIIIGTQGLIGLVAMVLTFMVPQVLFTRRVPATLWARPAVAPAVALCIQVSLVMVDNLSNAMPNPTYAIALGGLTGLTAIAPPSSRRDAARRLAEAEAFRAAGEAGPAEALYVRAIEEYASLVADGEEASDAGVLGEYAYAHEALADLLAGTPGRGADAELALARAAEIRQALAAADPDQPERFEPLAHDLENLGRLLGASGRLDEARHVWGQAVEIREGLTARFPSAPEFVSRHAESLNDLAWMLASRPGVDPETAHTAAAYALKAIDLDPSRAGFWNTLGTANYHAGDFEAAVAALNRSIQFGQGGTGFDMYLLAMAGARLGDLGFARDCFERANLWVEAHAPGRPDLAHLRDQAAALIPS